MNAQTAPIPATKDYVLPKAEGAALGLTRKAKGLFFSVLLLPTLACLVLLLVYRPVDEVPGALGKVLGETLFAGFFFAMFITIPWFIFQSGRMSKQVVSAWKRHDYRWYVKAFPEHVTKNGDAICRHCGNHGIHVKNILSRTFMRSHSCTRCGETLYFSPENV